MNQIKRIVPVGLLVALAAIALALVWGPALGQVIPPAKVQPKWEYKVVAHEFHELEVNMNKATSEGWEYVEPLASAPAPVGTPAIRTMSAVLMKRPKQ